MHKEPDYLDKKLFKNLLENLSYIVDKTNGVIQLKNKDNQRNGGFKILNNHFDDFKFHR